MATVFRFGLSKAHGHHRVDPAVAFATMLGNRLGMEARAEVLADYAQLMRATLTGGVELAWLPPLVHVECVKRGAQLLALCRRDGALTYRSALLVGTKSRFQRIEDLRQSKARIAWTDPSSAAGHVFPRRFLVASRIDPASDCASEEYFGTPRAACLAVANDQADLFATFVNEATARDPSKIVNETEKLAPGVSGRLRVLAVTPPICADGFVLGTHVSPELVSQVTTVLHTLHETAAGRDVLGSLTSAERLAPVGPEVKRVLNELERSLDQDA
jgi:phosphonate transport system substrate-binding protein